MGITSSLRSCFLREFFQPTILVVRWFMVFGRCVPFFNLCIGFTDFFLGFFCFLALHGLGMNLLLMLAVFIGMMQSNKVSSVCVACYCQLVLDDCIILWLDLSTIMVVALVGLGRFFVVGGLYHFGGGVAHCMSMGPFFLFWFGFYVGYKFV